MITLFGTTDYQFYALSRSGKNHSPKSSVFREAVVSNTKLTPENHIPCPAPYPKSLFVVRSQIEYFRAAFGQPTAALRLVATLETNHRVLAHLSTRDVAEEEQFLGGGVRPGQDAFYSCSQLVINQLEGNPLRGRQLTKVDNETVWGKRWLNYRNKEEALRGRAPGKFDYIFKTKFHG